MYFLLSKILLFLISPVFWIITLLLIAAFTNRKKLRKRTAIAGVVLLLLFANTWLYNCFIHTWEYKAVTLPANAHYSCVIVLGGFVSQVSATEGRFNSSADRFIQGVRLQLTGKVSHILISGGSASLNPGEFKEAEWVRGQLKQFHLADSAVLIESKARNTLENAKFSAALLKQSGLKPPYLLVTSAMHIRRAAMIFKNAGIAVQPYPCDFASGAVSTPTPLDLIPDLNVLTMWNGVIKEVCGYVVNSWM